MVPGGRLQVTGLAYAPRSRVLSMGPGSWVPGEGSQVDGSGSQVLGPTYESQVPSSWSWVPHFLYALIFNIFYFFLNVCKQTFLISHVRISQKVKGVLM